MKKSALFIVMCLSLSISASVFAQDLPKIAVYATGRIGMDGAKTVSTSMLFSLVNSGRYRGVERPNDFIDELTGELLAHGGEAGKNPLRDVGRRFGVRYVCITEIVPVPDTFQISARIIDVETSAAVFAGQYVSGIRTVNDIVMVSDWIVQDMLQRPAAPPQTDAPPEPAAGERPAGQNDNAPEAGHAAQGGVPADSAVRETVETAKPESAPGRQTEKYGVPPPKKWASVGIGGFFAGGFGGGIRWANGERIAMPYYGGGVYMFFDFVYAEIFAGYNTGGGKWASANIADPDDLPYMKRAYLNFGVSAKYPFGAGGVRFFPILGVEYESSVLGGFKSKNGREYAFDGESGRLGADALNALRAEIGGGLDVDLGRSAYLRAEALYGLRAANRFENDCVNNNLGYPYRGDFDGAMPGHGLAVKLGTGIRF